MSVLKTILYFSIFKYPLTKEEIFIYSNTPSIDELNKDLTQLLIEKKIHHIEGYFLPVDDQTWITRRTNGKILADKKIRTAIKMSKILIHFPYTRAIMISGTLSKGYMDKNTDIDFFVICTPGNIVISKFFMGTFRRLFAPKSFCVNYILDWDNLRIKDPNYYYAVEIATLIPLINPGLYHQFISSNSSWVEELLPNWKADHGVVRETKNSFLKIGMEKLLSTTLFLRIGKALQRFYLKRLGTKNHLNKISLVTKELEVKDGVFKGHNLGYAYKISNLFKDYQKDLDKNGVLNTTHHFYD